MLTWNQYAYRWAILHGGVDPRRARPEVRGWLRVAYEVGRVLARLRVPAGAVTTTGLLFGLATPVAAVRHGAWLVLAAVLVVAAGLADSVDGAVALVGGRTSPLGHLYDALADRLVELCWVIALWLIGVPGWLAVCCLAVAWLHEYVRARAAGAVTPAASLDGFAGAVTAGPVTSAASLDGAAGTRPATEVGPVTLAERPTRAAFAAAALSFAGLGSVSGGDISSGLATMFTAIWVAVGLLGLVQLLLVVVRTLGAAPGPAPLPPPVGPAAGPPPDSAATVAPAHEDPDDAEQTLSLLLYLGE